VFQGKMLEIDAEMGQKQALNELIITQQKELLKRSKFVETCLEIARAEQTNQSARDELLKCLKLTENTQSK
jgi:hypothetical protein